MLFATERPMPLPEKKRFLKLLPEKLDGLALKHALEVRNETFLVPEFAALARKYNAAIYDYRRGEYYDS